MTVALPLAVGWASALLLAPLDGRRRWVGGLACLLAAGVVAVLAALAVQVGSDGPQQVTTGGWPEQIGITLRADALGVLFALASAVLVAAVLAYEVAHGPETPSFPALVLFLDTGLTGIFLTADVFNFYVFFELSMVAAFALAGYGGGREESRAAAVFVVINLIGSVTFLGAVGVIYRTTGTLQMAAVARQVADAAPAALLLPGALLFVAFGLKLGLFPFHYWLPAVYRDTRPAVAALFAGALANLASYGLLRFAGDVLPGVLSPARPALLVAGGASVLYGSLVAVGQRDLRDMITYSSIGQVGYAVLALAVGTPAGLAAAALFALVNSLHKTALFLGAGSFGAGTAAAVLVAGASVAGLPPSAGFVAKLALFRAAAAAEDAGWLLLLLAAGSALSLVYVFQAWQQAFWPGGDADEAPAGGKPAPTPRIARALVVLLALAIVGLGLLPSGLLQWSERAAGALGATP